MRNLLGFSTDFPVSAFIASSSSLTLFWTSQNSRGGVGFIPEYFLHPDCLLQVVVNPYRELEAVVLFGVFPVENLPEEVVQVLVLWYVAHRRPDGVVLSVGSSLSPDDPDFLVDLLVGVLALVLQEVVRCEDSEWLFIRGSQIIDVTLYG